MSKNNRLFWNDKSGDFERIYKDYFDRLFAYALIISKSEIIAKDIVSDVFFNLWNTNIDLASIKDLKSYLFTSVKNQAIRTISNDPAKFNFDNYQIATTSIDYINPEELLIGKELDQFLSETINNLPPHCRLVFKMVKENQMKYENVATELGISIDTVKYHLKIAVKKIKVELEAKFDERKIVRWVSNGSVIILISELILHTFAK